MKKDDIKIAHTPKRFFEAAKEHAVGSNELLGGKCRGCGDSLDGKAEIAGLCRECARDTYEDRDYEIEDTD